MHGRIQHDLVWDLAAFFFAAILGERLSPNVSMLTGFHTGMPSNEIFLLEFGLGDASFLIHQFLSLQF